MKTRNERTGEYAISIYNADGELMDERKWTRNEHTGEIRILEEFKLDKNRRLNNDRIPKGHPRSE